MRTVVFGLHKFSDYCYGIYVTIESDHKPLEAISNKPLREAPKRLLRIMLSIQNFDYKITYKKGDVIITDAIPRTPVEDNKFQFHITNPKTSARIPIPMYWPRYHDNWIEENTYSV